MKKAIFLDIDGTLLDCLGGITDIRPVVKNAISSLQTNGHYVFVATGRPYAFLSKALLDFGFDGFILSNGAQVIVNGETIYSDKFDIEFISTLVAELDRLKVQYILEGGFYSYMKLKHKEFYEFFDKVGVSREMLIGDYNIKAIDVHKIELLCPDKDVAKLCRGLIDNYPSYGYFNSINEKALELYSKKNTKASAILRVLKHLDIPIENSYAFGDGINDIEMLSTVNCGIAMGNAIDEVKKHANIITESIHNDGVAVAIEKYILS